MELIVIADNISTILESRSLCNRHEVELEHPPTSNFRPEERAFASYVDAL